MFSFKHKYRDMLGSYKSASIDGLRVDQARADIADGFENLVEKVFADMYSNDPSFQYTNIASVPATHSYNMDEIGEKGIRAQSKRIFSRKREV